VFDAVYLLTMAIEAFKKIGLSSDLHIYLFPYFLYPLNYICFTGSTYMTVAIAIERYIAVYHPLSYKRAMTDVSTHKKRLAAYLVPVTLVSVLFNIPKFLESKLEFTEEGEVYLNLTDLRKSKDYVLFYHHWARLLVVGLIPLTVLSYLNTKIYVVIRRQRRGRRRRDEHLSIVLMLIVFIFVICNLPSFGLNLHELMIVDTIQKCSGTPLMGFPVWVLIGGFCSNLLLCVNSSANLFIYTCVGASFRSQMFDSLARGKGIVHRILSVWKMENYEASSNSEPNSAQMEPELNGHFELQRFQSGRQVEVRLQDVRKMNKCTTVEMKLVTASGEEQHGCGSANKVSPMVSPSDTRSDLVNGGHKIRIEVVTQT